jgi:hypothetical protein
MKKNLVRAAFSLFMLMVFTTSAYPQWVQTDWPASNSFFDLYAGQGMVFARTWDSLNGGRVFLTADSGTNWDQMSSADSDIDVLSIVIWDDNILAGTWNGFYLPTLDDTDWSWHVVTPTGIPADTAILSTAVIGDTLYAGAIGHIYESSADDPNIWTEAGTGIPANVRITCIATNGNAIFAGSDSNGVFIATNDGASWTAMNFGLADTHISQLTAMGTKLFAVTSKGVFVSDVNDVSYVSDADGPIWVSDPNGTTWLLGPNGTAWTSDAGHTIWVADSSGLKNVNCLLAADDLLLAGTDANGVYLSADSGLTWTPFSSGMSDDTRVWSLVASSDNLFIFAGTDSGVWRIPSSATANSEPTAATATSTETGSR